jgi:hypothetical protein
MAYFEKLGNTALLASMTAGAPCAWRGHTTRANELVRANALLTQYKDNSFDAAFSSMWQSTSRRAGKELFREIHGLEARRALLRRVPYNNIVPAATW